MGLISIGSQIDGFNVFVVVYEYFEMNCHAKQFNLRKSKITCAEGILFISLWRCAEFTSNSDVNFVSH
jgi:hypothetical protein